MSIKGIVKTIATEHEAVELLKKMGCDPAGITIMAPKVLFYTLYIESISTKAANLLKQTFLAKGAEVAVCRGTADLSVEQTPVLVCATLKQYRLALSQLRQQPWGLPSVADAIVQALGNCQGFEPQLFSKNGKHWQIQPGKTTVMGILNLTPDSFSDGGKYNQLDAAASQMQTMIADGADIIDIGAESTRPYGGSQKISADEEKRRLLPILEKLLAETTVPISVDTYKPEVAEAALALGVHAINDVWGLQQEGNMAAVVAKQKVPVIIMHNRISSDSDRDIMNEIVAYFAKSIEIAALAGIEKKNMVLDPGIGFGKNTQQNLEVLARLSELKSLGFPLLTGTSRKRFIGDILDLPVDQRLEGTAATLAYSILNGASIIRVHDVKMAKRVANMTDALKNWRIHPNG